MKEILGCRYCDNAKINGELTSENDFSSITIGRCEKYTRLMLSSGGYYNDVRIELEEFGPYDRWITKGIYYPKFCPECGRKIIENPKFNKEK